MSSPAVNVQPAYCPNCGNDDAVVPADVIRDPDEETILFTIAYRCIYCNEQYDPDNPG